MTNPDSGITSGFKASAGRAADSALALLRKRLELASIELAEERERLLARLGLMFAAVLLMVLGVLGICVFVAVYFWDTPQREAAVFIPAGLCMVSGIVLFRKFKSLGHSQGFAFSATLAEFDKDRAALSDPPKSTTAQKEAP